METKEYILCAAIKRLKPVSVVAYNYKTLTKDQDDIYSIEIGRRHNDIMARFGKKVLYVKQQGFYTSYGRFVDRKEALDIAKKAGQVGETYLGELYSEDLY